MKLLYITYISFGKFVSGSHVRPQKMYEAFKECGVEVTLLETQQNIRKKRKQKVKEILRLIDNEHIDVCYIESPSGPIFNYIDIKLIRKINKKNIPIALFYRDMNWKFNDIFRVDSLIDKLKQFVVKMMCIRDLVAFDKYIDLIYFPSLIASKYVSFSKKKAVLPPACESHNFLESSININKLLTAIYVGGVSDFYGTDNLIKSFHEINRTDISINLILICREFEWEKYCSKYQVKEMNWLRVYHTDERKTLSMLYQQADFAIHPISKNEYSDMAISVKIYEYVSYYKPILVTNCDVMSEIISSNEIGIVCEDNPQSMEKAIRFFIDNPIKLIEFKNNCIKMRETNLWIDRAKTVLNDLEILKSKKIKA